jgi:hypothetical protein
MATMAPRVTDVVVREPFMNVSMLMTLSATEAVTFEFALTAVFSPSDSSGRCNT